MTTTIAHKALRPLLIALLWLFASASGHYAFCQNNPYKINDKIYPAFLELQTLASNSRPTCIATADSIIIEAEKLGDHKAVVATDATKVQYALNVRNLQLLEKLVPQVKAEAEKYGYPQYYFYAAQAQVNYYLNGNNFTTSKQLLEKLEEEAKTKFGGKWLYTCYQLYGNYYRALRNEERSIPYFRRAIELCTLYHPDQDLTTTYISLALAYRYSRKYDESIQAIDEGLKALKDRDLLSREYRLLDNKCFTLFHIPRMEEGEKVYQQLQDPKFKRLKKTRTNFNDIMHFIYKKDYESARKSASIIHENYLRYMWLGKVETACGNYKLANEYNIQAFKYLEDYNAKQRQIDFAQANADIGNHLLEAQNAELKLKSSELALHNSQLAMERQRNLYELQRAEADKSRLELANKELSLNQLQTAINERDAQRKLREADFDRKEAISHNRIVVEAVALIFSIIIILMLLAYAILRRRSLRLLKQKNDQLTEALHRAEESEKTKMRFLQNMSHEIRTPLNAIVGFSQLLAHQEDTDDFTEEQKQEFIDLVDQNTENLTTLIDDILSISALEHGTTLKLSFSQCNVNAILNSALSSVRHRCPQNVELRCSTEIDDQFTFVCDSHRLQQVLTNFLTNAEKHTEEGEILLHASLNENPGKITFSVTDTGEGVPAENAETIFNRFEKLDTFTQGTGLGLNICRMIANHLHGTVKLDTTHTGAGARFVFILPLTQPDV